MTYRQTWEKGVHRASTDPRPYEGAIYAYCSCKWEQRCDRYDEAVTAIERHFTPARDESVTLHSLKALAASVRRSTNLDELPDVLRLVQAIDSL
jgi:hypothetical protein